MSGTTYPPSPRSITPKWQGNIKTSFIIPGLSAGHYITVCICLWLQAVCYLSSVAVYLDGVQYFNKYLGCYVPVLDLGMQHKHFFCWCETATVNAAVREILQVSGGNMPSQFILFVVVETNHAAHHPETSINSSHPYFVRFFQSSANRFLKHSVHILNKKLKVYLLKVFKIK